MGHTQTLGGWFSSIVCDPQSWSHVGIQTWVSEVWIHKWAVPLWLIYTIQQLYFMNKSRFKQKSLIEFMFWQYNPEEVQQTILYSIRTYGKNIDNLILQNSDLILENVWLGGLCPVAKDPVSRENRPRTCRLSTYLVLELKSRVLFHGLVEAFFNSWSDIYCEITFYCVTVIDAS